MPAAKLNFGVIDFSREKSTFGLYVPEVTAANIEDTINDESIGGLAFDLRTVIAAVTIGNFTGMSLTIPVRAENDLAPEVATAQRELGLRILYLDTVTGDKYHVTIPCPKVNDVTFWVMGTDKVNPENVQWLALTAAIEANCVSKDGNPIEVQDGYLVGRRS